MKIKTKSVEKNTHFVLAEYLMTNTVYILGKDYLKISVVFFETKEL